MSVEDLYRKQLAENEMLKKALGIAENALYFINESSDYNERYGN